MSTSKLYGWTGRILSVNLSDRTHTVINPPIELYKKFIGGKGLAGHYLRPHIMESWDSPTMPLLFFTGPLVNTPSPTSGRMTIMSRSPLTGTVGDTSVGGKLGIHIKKAGWDGIIITGRSDTLCSIKITDDKVSINDAAHLAGMELTPCLNYIGAEGAAALIGPAAENGVLFSTIAVGSHFFAGRGGPGLVMASKNLKYMHVHGTGKTAVHDMDELKKAREEIFRLASASPILRGELGIAEFGTGALFDLMHSRRMMPTKNFTRTHFPSAPDMNAWHYREKYKTKKTGCAGCHILCKKSSANGSPIPEFETMSHFSALLENNNLDLVMEANSLCNELGMDTITAAATLACYAEIYDEKLAPGQITGLLRDIACSEGIGTELKLGSRLFAELMEQPELSMSVKGLEMSAYDPRGAYGMALAYATSTRGACHLRAYPISHEILRKPVATDRFSFSGKARIIKLSEDMNAVIDSLTACKFIFFAASLEEYSRAYSAVTGTASTAQDLMEAGERIYYQERMMNAENGFSIDDDMLPPRFFNEAGSSSKDIAISPLSRDDFKQALLNYYRVRGLSETGMPTEKKSRELGLK